MENTENKPDQEEQFYQDELARHNLFASMAAKSGYGDHDKAQVPDDEPEDDDDFLDDDDDDLLGEDDPADDETPED